MRARLTFPPTSEDVGAIRACRLFDADWYLETYPDVKALGMDPAEHYLWFGARLDRNPSPRFNTAGHRKMNPGTADDTANPLFRFISRHRTAERPAARAGELRYSDWIARNDTLGEGDRALIHRHMAGFRNRPKFSILMPVYDPPGDYLRQAIDSVLAQLYPHWELCIADDASRASHIRPVLEAYACTDARIKLAFRDENGGISALMDMRS